MYNQHIEQNAIQQMCVIRTLKHDTIPTLLILLYHSLYTFVEKKSVICFCTADPVTLISLVISFISLNFLNSLEFPILRA